MAGPTKAPPVETAAEETSPLAALATQKLPATDYTNALQHFRRPFAPAAVKWKVQTEIWEGDEQNRRQGAIVVAYIDARLVIERLNLVWPWWDEDKVPAGQGATRCTLTIMTADYVDRAVITRKTDVGQGGDVKTMESDSLKRTAVHLGIGVSIYALAAVKMMVGHAPGEVRLEPRRKKKDNKWVTVMVPFLDRETQTWLAKKYEMWLEARGERLFGPALDHGDEEEATGLDMESPAAAAAATGGEAVQDTKPEDAAETYQPMTDERTGELRLQAEGVYAQVRRVKPKHMTPASFQAKLLKASSTSHADIEALIEGLEQVRDAAEVTS